MTTRQALGTAFVLLLAISFQTEAVARSLAPPNSDARKIYEALDVEEKDVTVGRIRARTYAKSVGGLRCTEVTVPGSDSKSPSYGCTFTPRGRDARIYAALNVRAQRDRRPMGGMIVDFKAVGNLHCRESRSVRPSIPTRTTCELR